MKTQIAQYTDYSDPVEVSPSKVLKWVFPMMVLGVFGLFVGAAAARDSDGNIYAFDDHEVDAPERAAGDERESSFVEDEEYGLLAPPQFAATPTLRVRADKETVFSALEQRLDAAQQKLGVAEASIEPIADINIQPILPAEETLDALQERVEKIDDRLADAQRDSSSTWRQTVREVKDEIRQLESELRSL